MPGKAQGCTEVCEGARPAPASAGGLKCKHRGNAGSLPVRVAHLHPLPALIAIPSNCRVQGVVWCGVVWCVVCGVLQSGVRVQLQEISGVWGCQHKRVHQTAAGVRTQTREV